jgi:hypothetical protein
MCGVGAGSESSKRLCTKSRRFERLRLADPSWSNLHETPCFTSLDIDAPGREIISHGQTDLRLHRVFFALLIPAAHCQSVQPESFLIEPNRPMAYLSVDHVGFGAAEGGVRKERVWLRFKNNCRLPIDLHANGAPTDAPFDDMTVMYELIRPTMRGILVTEDGPHPKAKRVTPPPDTMSEVGSSVTVLSGESALFSVPSAHFSKDWEMHIPFKFRLPPGKGPRDDNAWGGEPEMFLTYTFWDLRPSVQRALTAKRSGQ